MKSSEVKIPWAEGLHARPASRLVRIANSFSSTIQLKCGQKIANGRSILGVLLLAASLGATIQIEASGADEEAALDAVCRIFDSPER